MVSNHLIETILSCDGLIYLRGGASADSFWVAFERDYAIRAGKRVFSFDPMSGMLVRDRSKALDLAVFPIWGASDTERVVKMIEFMRDKRYFAPWDLRRLTKMAIEDLRPTNTVAHFPHERLTFFGE
jgi:hypothetical protein